MMSMDPSIPLAGQVDIFQDMPPMNEIISEKITLLENMGRDDAFFIINLSDIYHKIEQWRRLLPRVYPFYALKCNNDAMIARFLAQIGIGFDCASKAELQQISDLGVPPTRVIYANPCKQISHLQFAADLGVDLMTFDDLHELRKIKRYFPNARLLLRIQSSKLHKAKHNFNKKFGCDLREARTLLEHAKQMELNIVGVSFHVGSLPEDVTSFSATISESSKVFHIGEELGFDMTILDIGGGFPGVDTQQMSIGKVASVVNEALDTHFPVERGVRVIAEPGRYVVSSSLTLAVHVIAKRVVSDQLGEHAEVPTNTCACECQDMRLKDNVHVTRLNQPIRREDTWSNEPIREKDTRLRMYYVNDGIYGSFNNVFTDHASVQPRFLKPFDNSGQYRSVVWGPTCDGLDCIIKECLLPELDVGQWMYFHDMGAYTVSLSCNFNGISRPLRFYVCDDVTLSLVNHTAASPAGRYAKWTQSLNYMSDHSKNLSGGCLHRQHSTKSLFSDIKIYCPLVSSTCQFHYFIHKIPSDWNQGLGVKQIRDFVTYRIKTCEEKLP